MLQPIQKEHELICPCGCGVVVGYADENHNGIEKPNIPLSINVQLLGSALNKSKKYAFTSKPLEFYEERVLRQLVDITKEFELPEILALDTFNELKRKKRGFRSELQPMKQLIQILSKDDYYMYIHKLRLLKARYEQLASNI